MTCLSIFVTLTCLLLLKMVCISLESGLVDYGRVLMLQSVVSILDVPSECRTASVAVNVLSIGFHLADFK